MEWFTHALVLVLAILLLAQVIHNFKRDQAVPYVRWFGALTLLVVAFGCILYLLLKSGALVLSPEFGLVLVRGTIGWVAAQVLIASLAIGAAIGWHTARLATASKSRLGRYLGLGIAVALLSVVPLFGLDALNPQDPASHRVYRYDVWWPPLLIWISVCTVEATLTALKVESRQIRIWLVTAFVTALAYYVLREPQPIFLNSKVVPDSVGLWTVTLAILLPFNMGLGTWLTLRLREQQPSQGRWKRRGATLIPAVFGLVSAWLWYMFPYLVPLYLPWAVWFVWLVLLAMVAGRRLYRARRAKPESASQPSRQVLGFSILLLVLLTLTLTLPHVAYLSITNPITVFTCVAFSWIVLAEAILPGPIRPLAQWTLVQNIRTAESPLRYVWGRLRPLLVGAGTAIWSSIRAIFNAQSWPVALLKALLGIVVIIALSDIPHAGKTIIQPFKVSIKDKESASDRLGQITSDHLQHALIALQRDLQPEDIEIGGTEKSSAPKFVPPAKTGTSAFATSPDLEIGPLKVPVAFIDGLIREPMRRYVYNVNVIDGTLYEDGTQHYSLLVGSTDGTSWKVSSDSGTVAESLARLTDLLALHIMRTDTRSSSAPRTDKAFDAFRAGLAAWKSFKNQESWDALTDAIHKFREATQEDPMFALAHYRLGLALLDEGQPGAATEAFRAAIKADPTLVAGRLALATTLTYFDYYYRTPAASPIPTSSNDVNKDRYLETHRLLLQVVDSADSISGRNLASAYYGLCRVASLRDEHQLAFFYCQRAVGLYTQLHATKGMEQQNRADEATVLNELGVILENSSGANMNSMERGWHCSAARTDELQEGGEVPSRSFRKSPYLHTALRYYEIAKELLPDDQIIRCNYASAAYALGNLGPMGALDKDAAAHLQLAESYRSLAASHTHNPNSEKPWLAAAYYRLALKEFRHAVRGESDLTAVNPQRFDALNGYAYAFWQWRLNSPEESTGHLLPDDAEAAETYARQALLLSANKPEHIQAMARSTLGEVLLALARPVEATEELEAALKQTPRHPLFHEIRWDLAQAYICADENDPPSGASTAALHSRTQRAISLLKEIRQEEQGREHRPFTDKPHLLNPAYYQRTCARDSLNLRRTASYPIQSIPAANSAQYVLQGGLPKYTSFMGQCSWSGIAANVIDATNEEIFSLWLHVWGGGINSRIPTNQNHIVGLGYKPRNTRWYYFAQLEDENRKPVSEVYAVETKGDCSKNVARLDFEKRKPASNSP